MFKNKTLLITGGTGSFGNAVLDKFSNSDISEIRIFSRDEKKQDDMRKAYHNKKIKFHVGDVRNYRSLQDAMYGVNYVFHAAALKQVPSCEFFPMEAVKTNVEGTDHVIRAADEAGVEKVICLSTDKAAYPINAMGISKAMMEKVLVARSRNTKMMVCGTRYGNVMCSRGSVIPLFIQQIKQNKNITITDPTMTRFMMSLEEAVDLVEFAFNHAQAGDIFVQKAPACTLLVLAETLKEIFHAHNNIEMIGLRHGEKIHETLLTEEEAAKAEDMGNFYRVPADVRDLNYSQYLEAGENPVKRVDEYNSANTEQLSNASLKEKLLALDYVQKELAAWGNQQ